MKIAWKLFGVVFLSLVLGADLLMIAYHMFRGVEGGGWIGGILLQVFGGIFYAVVIFVLCTGIGNDIKKGFDKIAIVRTVDEAVKRELETLMKDIGKQVDMSGEDFMIYRVAMGNYGYVIPGEQLTRWMHLLRSHVDFLLGQNENCIQMPSGVWEKLDDGQSSTEDGEEPEE